MTDKRPYAIEYRRVSDSELYKVTCEDWGDGESPRGASQFHRALVSHVVVASSDKAYGDSPVLPYTEDMPPNGRQWLRVADSSML